MVEDDRERRCIVTRTCGSPDAMLRFVRSPDGVATPDFSGRLPGRGAWVSLSRPMVEKAVRQKLFARALRGPVDAPADLADRVETGLRKTALGALGLARRAGEATTGFEKTRAAFASGKAAALVVATDAGEDGREKLTAAARGRRIVDAFSAEELSQALGASVVYASVSSGGAGARFLAAVARLERFLAEEAEEPRQ